jgi:hypothetical protein
LVQQEPRGHREFRASKGSQAFLEYLGFKAYQALPEQLDHKALKEKLVRKGRWD